MKTCKDK